MRTLILLLCSLLLAAGAFAKNQEQISGTITNTSGKAIGGAVISAEQEGKVKLKTAANAAGTFSFTRLESGDYEIRISAAGYESMRFLQVHIGKEARTLELNATLTPAGAWGASTQVKIYYASYKAEAGTARKEKSSDRALKEVVVRSYGKPMIDARTSGSYSTHTSEEIERGAVHNLSDIAALSTVSYESKSGAPVSIGGGRAASSSHMELPEGKSGFVAPPEGAATYAPPASPAPRAGMLTSGEINDFSKWTLWEDISMDELKTYRSTWPFQPEHRFTVLLKSADGKPLCNARVVMNSTDGKAPVWEAMTDNTGKAELWDGMYIPAGKRTLSATVTYNDQSYPVANLKEFSDGANIINTRQPCNAPGKLDIAFIVDATGSMQDEINYLKAELTDILGKVKDSLPSMQVHTGCVFYRDLNDAYVAKISDLKPDFTQTLAFIRDNNADGGDDFPEAVDVALQQGLDGLHWREDAVARIAFLILDAPPHSDAATVKRMQDLAYQYAKRGIRLVPVVCSGSDKSTEYLMRSLALATNGTYLFLTNHSGIGGSHIEPTTDKYDVEYLNGLIFRVIYQCSFMPACRNNPVVTATDTATVHQKLPADSTGKGNELVWKYYPNPTSGILHIEHRNTAGEMYICDISGKAIMRFNADPSGITVVDVSNYPSGIYFIRYHYSPEHWVDGKFVVMH